MTMPACIEMSLASFHAGHLGPNELAAAAIATTYFNLMWCASTTQAKTHKVGRPRQKHLMTGYNWVLESVKPSAH